MKTKIFNTENTVKTNVIRSVIGLLITIISIIAYYSSYTKIDVEQLLEYEGEIIILFLCVLALIIGITLLISSLNLHNTITRYLLVFTLGATIYAIIREEPMRVGFAILIFCLIIFIITRTFSKVSSTIITFSVSYSVIIPLLYLFADVLKVSPFVSLYTSISIMLLLYNILGVKLNRLCLKLMHGTSTANVNKYDYNELKNQINFLYLVLFIVLNLSLMYSEQDQISTLANCINNALITGVCITNVDWQALFKRISK